MIQKASHKVYGWLFHYIRQLETLSGILQYKADKSGAAVVYNTLKCLL